MVHNFKDITGQRFGKLTVSHRADNRYSGQAFWACICDCGAATETNTARLISGRTKSCGCIGRNAAYRHGMHNTTEYRIWQQAKERCHNPRKASFQRYGARGVFMIDRWRNDFVEFYTDMGRRPSLNHSLDRIDNEGPYSPENCRWATNEVQYRNRRQTVWIEFQGETLCAKDWCRRYGLDEATFAARLKRKWPLEKALLTPVKKQKGKNC